MQSQYFSKIYRGFLVEQTDKGWVVPQMPSWSRGPVSQGPYGTYQIACHVLDRVLDEQERSNSNNLSDKRRVQEENYDSDSSGLSRGQAIGLLVLVVLFFMFPKQFILSIDFIIGGSIHLVFSILRGLGHIGQWILS